MEKDMERVLDGLDEQILTMMKQWNLPGLSVGIVKNGNVVMTKGYGKRDEKNDLDMTGKTMLPIGSTTKSFTALILGMLVDEGKLDWDKPVKEYIPWLKLYDSYVTDHVTTRDLLCHRTGVPGYDIHGVFCTKDDRKEMVKDLVYLQANTGFRTKLQYQNQMVMLAGYVAEVLTGQTWEELVKERICKPLGMTNTTLTIPGLEGYTESSKGYVFTGTENMETPYLSLKGVGPAGAINSTAEDMTNYLLFQLGDGTWNGKQLISKANLDEMHTAQMLGTPYFWKLDEITNANYGMGWFVDLYRGQKMLSHGGNTLGFSALMTLLPEQDFGVILLSNATSNFMIYALTYAILDKVLGVETQDWTAKMQMKIGEVFGAMGAAMQAKAEAKIPNTAPSHPLEAYSGVYSHPAFGKLEISVADGQLTGTLNGHHVLITHYHYDIFDMVLTLMGAAFTATFQTGMTGAIESVSALVEPTVAPVVFVRENK